MLFTLNMGPWAQCDMCLNPPLPALCVLHWLLPRLLLSTMYVLTGVSSCCAVIEGMDLVYKIEGQGSPSGTPKKTVTIRKSGELKGTSTS